MSDNPAEVIRATFASRLKHEMAVRNWNQSDLAREASKHLPGGEIARDNISNYANAKALPGPGFLLAMAKALNTTPDDLLPERGMPPQRNAGVLPSTDVRDAGEGYAFLRVNKRVPWPVAVKILEILNAERKKDLAAEGYPDNG